MRPWAPKKIFDWARVNRLDVVVKRAEGDDDDVIMHVYYQPEGSWRMNAATVSTTQGWQRHSSNGPASILLTRTHPKT